MEGRHLVFNKNPSSFTSVTEIGRQQVIEKFGEIIV